MTLKKTRRASVFSMIWSIIMLVAYFIMGQFYILIAALSQVGNGITALSICTHIGIYIGIAAMLLGLANIIISIITLAKTGKTAVPENTKKIVLIMMILLFALTGLNFLIFAVVVIPMQASLITFSHLVFAILYLPFALGTMRDYRNLKNLNTIPTSSETITAEDATITE